MYTRKKYVSAGNGAVDVFPTRMKMTRTKDQNVHDIGSMRQQHLAQLPQLTILDSEPNRQPCGCQLFYSTIPGFGKRR